MTHGNIGRSPTNKTYGQADEPLVNQLFDIVDELKVSQEKLSQLSGIHRQEISGHRTGRQTPMLSTLIELGNAIGYKLVWKPFKDDT